MSDRLVVQLIEWAPRTTNGGVERTVLLQVTEPTGVAGVGRFTCAGDDPAFVALGSADPQDDVVTSAGQLLLRAVSSSTDVVRDLFTRALTVQQPDSFPIYLDLSNAKESQALPWEALCTDDGVFFALEDRWPVGRMLTGTANAVLDRTFEPPLRLAAVLACLGIEAAGEWQALRDAVENSGAPVRVLLLVAEPELHDSIAELGLDWLELAMVPRTYPDLQRFISRFDPHLLHFFCHGRATGGPHLEIATAPDQFDPAGGGHHRLEAKSIRELVSAKEAPWVIVLNACETAANDGDRDGAHSLAANLVVEQGVPAVIGMRKPVLGSDAARFSSAFYTAVLTDLAKRVDQGPGDTTIDWAGYLVAARSALCRDRGATLDAVAARYHEWTLPVVVARPGRFTVNVVVPAPGDAAPREQATLTADAAAAVLAAIAKLAPADTVEAFEQAMRVGRQRAGARP